MSTLDLPAALPVMQQLFGVQSYDLTSTNPDSGSSQVTVLGHPRRTCSLVSEERIASRAEAAMWRSLVQGMRGQVNVLAVHDLLNPVPRGTARGVWSAVGAAAGGSVMSIQLGNDQAGATLLQGDWIGVNQTSNHRQLLHVQADAVADAAGRITVQFEPVLRLPVTAGGAVVWDRPTCRMRRTESKTGWSSEGHSQGGFSLELLESWE